ncbi:TfoX/Sxy family DNA transformation protein [Jannaschia sp. CCS1]|uniref:TfoX/Sxy family DNA transformation protein n=1 Tax=Jannaschia sp. (strain CCS1) TaxID=290400 RepID=UPI0003100F44|nr:TfoX/Sxy family DNA transformation protein [Jannaschia sp. CCS1]
MTDTLNDSDPVTVIRNIGPAQAEVLAAAGIHTAAALRKLGAHEAYRAILRTGTAPHFIMYYVLHMALQGRPWNDCKGAEKEALRAQFDALKAGEAAAGNDPELERMLNAIGTGLRR